MEGTRKRESQVGGRRIMKEWEKRNHSLSLPPPQAKTPPPLTQPAGEESKSAHRGPSVPSGGDHPKGGEGAEKKEGGEGRKDRGWLLSH